MPFVSQINVSAGGVPKLPVEGPIQVGPEGILGDGHVDTENHGGPQRALCLYSLEVIEALRAEGHPIGPGSAGENLTISGLDWTSLAVGDRLHIGDEVVAELTKPTTPCVKNARWFREGDFRRMSHHAHPGWSRWYAGVVTGGMITAGDTVTVVGIGPSTG